MPQFACLCLITLGVGGLRKACWLTNHVGRPLKATRSALDLGSILPQMV